MGQNKKVAVVLCIALFLLTHGGCSVGMALHGADNPDIAVLRSGQSRGVVEMELGKPKSFDIEERRALYDYSTGEDGSAGRAIAHGAADFLTLGLWEVVGTPVEAVQKHTFWSLSVWYTEEDRVIRWSEPRRR
tara:strand:+ start:16101 stop:16499 length:399 start_codon:yes stop_codon:yes gene_type:complete